MTKIYTKECFTCLGCPNSEFDDSWQPCLICSAMDCIVFEGMPPENMEFPEWCPLPDKRKDGK